MPFLVICILRFALWLCGIIFIEHGRLSIRKSCWGWGVHWRMAQWLRAHCSCWGPQVYSQPTPGSSQLSLTPVLGDLAPSPGLWDYELTARFSIEHGEEVCPTQVHAREATCIVLQVFLKTLNIGCGDLCLPIQHLGDWGRKIVTSSRPTWTTAWDSISECRKGTKSISPFSTVLSCFPFELQQPSCPSQGLIPLRFPLFRCVFLALEAIVHFKDILPPISTDVPQVCSLWPHFKSLNMILIVALNFCLISLSHLWPFSINCFLF